MPTDATTPKPLKAGKLEVCVKGILSKSWLPKWCVLYPGGGKDPPRIELSDPAHDQGGEGTAKKHKTLSLKDIKKVRRPTKGKDFSLDVTTKREKHQLAAESEAEVQEWHHYLRGLITISASSASTGSMDGESEDSTSHDGSDHHGDDGHSMNVLFDNNILYESADPKMQFEVVVNPNEDAVKLKLRGSYLLVINDFALSLVDQQTSQPVCIWPYKCIRRYGKTLEMFSFEVGRKSTTGPGSFSFETEHGLRIFQLAQSKLEKMRRDEMLSREKFQLQCHQNDDAIPRSLSVDSNSRGAYNAPINRSSLPATDIRRELEEKMRLAGSSDLSKPRDFTPSTTDKPKPKSKKEKQKKEKAEKEKQKEEKKKAKQDKKKEKTKSSDKSHTPEGVQGKPLLPAIDTEVASRLKSLSVSEDGKSTPGALKQTPTPPPTSVKPNFKKGHETPAQSKLDTSTSPQPEQLYSLPAGKNTKLSPFPKQEKIPKQEKVAGARLYEEPDLLLSANVVPAYADNPYDEVTPPPAGLVKMAPAGVQYSSTSNREGAWQNMGMTDQEMKHKENYNRHNVKKGGTQPQLPGPTDASGMYSLTGDRTEAWRNQGFLRERHVEEHYSQFNDRVEDGTEEGLYEPTEAPSSSHLRALTANDLASSDFHDEYYDHLQFQSVMTRPNPKGAIQQEEGEQEDTYAHINLAAQAQTAAQAQPAIHSPPAIQPTRPGHEYEAVFPPTT